MTPQKDTTKCPPKKALKIYNLVSDWEILDATLPLKARVCRKIWDGTTNYNMDAHIIVIKVTWPSVDALTYSTKKKYQKVTKIYKKEQKVTKSKKKVLKMINKYQLIPKKISENDLPKMTNKDDLPTVLGPSGDK